MSDLLAGPVTIMIDGSPSSSQPERTAQAGPSAWAAPVRPQPLGTFPLPAGYLLIPGGADTEAARVSLLAGRAPDPWPERLRAHELALAGDRGGALAALAAAGSDPVSRYNRFVLDPDGLGGAGAEDSEDGEGELQQLRADLGEFGPLVDLVSFVLGRTVTPPEPGSAEGEIAALLLSAQATHELAAGEPTEALRLLHQAARTARPVAPPLAGLMLGAAASISQEVFGLGESSGPANPGPAVLYEQALLALSGAEDLRVSRAELHLGLAGALHELSAQQPQQLALAVPHYHSVLQLITAEQAPELWAAAHANLAAAYLTMPMTQASDQLRLGVAVQSLRHALKVYTPQTHPERWASTQLNLANSLVYTPSRHQADNLVEALELYEAVLQVRGRHSDPIGRARVLANQGNVLAHLGQFAHARAKLHEARFLFEEFSDGDSVRMVRGLLDEIARQQVLVRNQDQDAE
ncbi:MAG TPA: hypothetical protein VGX23_21695 [Actinocrinis sp.]|nr:hypothetical protein [Actinocrinis sp.]